MAVYPGDGRLKKIAARCMTMGQAGEYNFPRCAKRGDQLSAQYAETKFCADTISIIFLLNRRYVPFYKWMHLAVKLLPLLGEGTHDVILTLLQASDFREKESVIEEICMTIIKEFAGHGLSNSNSTFILDHGPQIHSTIRDKALRERNVWVG